MKPTLFYIPPKLAYLKNKMFIGTAAGVVRLESTDFQVSHPEELCFRIYHYSMNI